jgi:hypothetical protein
VVGVNDSPRLSRVIVDTILAGFALIGLYVFSTFLVDFTSDLRLARLAFFTSQDQSFDLGSVAESRHWQLVFLVLIFNNLDICNNSG